MIKTGHLAYITILILLGWLFIANAGCREGRPIQADAEGLGVAPEEIVLARVGEQEITLADFLAKDLFHYILSEVLVTQEIIKQEAARRGIVIPPEEIEEMYNNHPELASGMQAYLDKLSPSVPPSVALDSLRATVVRQLSEQAILTDAFETEHGPITDEEIEDIWSTQEQPIRRQVANDLGIDAEEVTLEDAMDLITGQVMNNWMQANYEFQVKEWKDRHVLVNYAFDFANEPLPEEIEVPPIEEDTGSLIDTESDTEELIEQDPEGHEGHDHG